MTERVDMTIEIDQKKLDELAKELAPFSAASFLPATGSSLAFASCRHL